jgi:uncharacterized protein
MNSFRLSRIRSKGILDFLSHWTTAHPRTIVALVLSLSALSVLYSYRHLEFLTGRNQLISADKPYLQLSDEYSETFQGLEQLVVVAEGKDIEETKEFIGRLGEQLQKDKEHIDDVFYQIDLTSLEGKKLLLLPPKDLRVLRDQAEEYQDLIRDLATSPGLNTLLTDINRKISSAMVNHLMEGLLGIEGPEEAKEKKPVDISFFRSLLGQMQSVLGPDRLVYRSPWADLFGNDKLSSDGFLLSDDKRFVFLLADPHKRGEGFNARQESIDALRLHIAELRHAFPGVQAGVTGEKALNNDEMASAQSDSSLATILSLIGVALLYLLFFRNVRRTLILVCTVAVDLMLTIGLATLTVGHLSILSIFVGPILIGLGDDRVVYFLSRYEEERDLGRSFQEAIRITLINAGPGIAVAALTNAIAFYAMTLADFQGVQELGLIVGNGMLVSCFTTLTFLPALLTLSEGKRTWKPSMRSDTWLAKGFRAWDSRVQRLRRPVLIFASVITLLCLFALPSLTFDYNLLHLQAQSTESVIWENRIVESSGRSSWFALATAPTLADAAQKAQQMEALSSVERVDTIASLVPESQEERLGLVREIQPLFAGLPSTLPAAGAVDVARLRLDLKKVLLKMQGKRDTWDPQKKPPEQEITEVKALLTDVLARLEALSVEDASRDLDRLQLPLFRDFADKWALLSGNLDPSGPITLTEVPSQIARRFVSEDGRKFLLQIYPRKDIWDHAPLKEFLTQLEQVDPEVTGSPVIAYESIQAMKNGYLKGGLYAAVAIILISFVTLRRVRDTLLAVLPVVMGMLWAAGLMWLFHLSFNLANLVAIPITIGIGVESGIYLSRRAHEEERDGGTLVGGSTGQAIALFSLSTMVGFGSLMVARHDGIFSMGLLLTLSVGSVLMVSVTVLPLLLRIKPRE